MSITFRVRNSRIYYYTMLDVWSSQMEFTVSSYTILIGKTSTSGGFIRALRYYTPVAPATGYSCYIHIIREFLQSRVYHFE